MYSEALTVDRAAIDVLGRGQGRPESLVVWL